MRDADYADDPALLAPAQAKSQLHSLEKAAAVISCYVNANKTEYICFKEKGAMSTLSGHPLELVDQIIYLGSNI